MEPKRIKGNEGIKSDCDAAVILGFQYHVLVFTEKLYIIKGLFQHKLSCINRLKCAGNKIFYLIIRMYFNVHFKGSIMLHLLQCCVPAKDSSNYWVNSKVSISS